MTFSDLVEDIKNCAQGSGYTDTEIKTRINRLIKRIARGVPVPGKFCLTPPLPSLYTTGTVATVPGSGIADLPSDYSRHASHVEDSDGEEITVNPSFVNFTKKYGGTISAGDVVEVAFVGNRIAYRDSPSVSENLTVHYYTEPDELTADSDEPDCIPEGLHDTLIVSGVAKDIFDRIEDGMEGAKVNTSRHVNIYNQALEALEIELGEDGEPDEYDDDSGGYIR